EPGWPALPPAVASFRGRLRPDALVRADGSTWREEPLALLAGVPVVAVAGGARPERVVTTLGRRGARGVRRLVFPDPHAYGEADGAAVTDAARTGLAVTTEKDLAKLGERAGLAGLRALRVSLEVDGGDRLVGLLERP